MGFYTKFLSLIPFQKKRPVFRKILLKLLMSFSQIILYIFLLQRNSMQRTFLHLVLIPQVRTNLCTIPTNMYLFILCHLSPHKTYTQMLLNIHLPTLCLCIGTHPRETVPHQRTPMMCIPGTLLLSTKQTQVHLLSAKQTKVLPFSHPRTQVQGITSM